MASDNAASSAAGDRGAVPDEDFEPPWVWTQQRGWTQLAEEGLERGNGDIRGYFADTQTWENFGSETFAQELRTNPSRPPPQSWYGGGGHNGTWEIKERVLLISVGGGKKKSFFGWVPFPLKMAKKM